jgi:predicted CXXCH cytochrome family protein
MVRPVARSAAFRLGLGSLVLAGAWLLLAAMPVAADGGPHIAGSNSGTSTLTPDTCAGCHRAHTAQGQYLINQATTEDLCLGCHGSAGVGATTNVDDGVQYAVANDGNGQPIAGALRSGGFVNARIDSAHSSRISYPYLSSHGYIAMFSSKVGVLTTDAATTSAHLDLDGTGRITAKGVAWGNGTSANGAGPNVTAECTSCHNPHGNGQYRILNPIPTLSGNSFVAATAPGVTVTDAALPVGAGAASVRNYTVQMGRTLGDVLAGTYVNDGQAGTPSATGGDYWRRYLPWDGVPGWDPQNGDTPATGQLGDVPMYVPGAASNLTTFSLQISAWCSACHTRYFVGGSGPTTNSGDPIFTYRHVTSRLACTQCHVAHGSNASMDGTFSGSMTYPDGSAPTSVVNGPTTTYLNSRLLKMDNRGTCAACHDPTNTIPYDGNYTITH